MNDPLIARFADACEALGPLELAVGLADGSPLAEGRVQQPFALVGRDDACDVTLTDPGVNPRHAWVQVVGGRAFVVDLDSRTGLTWASGAGGSGWLDPGDPVGVGPFRLRLTAPPGVPTRARPADPTRPEPDPDRPAVTLEFRNGRRFHDRWAVDRAVTLVGRADGCKVRLAGDDVAGYHCGLVLTPAGLWVVDLSGRGVVVGGERMRVAPLPAGAELWVGRYLIGCHRSAGGPRVGVPVHLPLGPPDEDAAVRPAVADDEVPLGGLPAGAGRDPTLSSSHVLAELFDRPPEPGSEAEPEEVPVVPVGRVPPGPLGRLLRKLGDAQARMLDEFHQSLKVTAELFDRVPAAPAAVVRRELARIQDLTAELVRLQGDLTRFGTDEPPVTRIGPADRTPLPGHPPLAGGLLPDPEEAVRDWVEERVGVVLREREARWDRLVGLIAAAEAAGART